MADLTVETIKLVHPHYTDAQAAAHLEAHKAAEPLRALIPVDARVSGRANQVLSSIVALIATAAR